MKGMMLAVFVCCLLAYGGVASPASVRDETTSGKCGDCVDWTFNETSNIIIFNGTGDMYYASWHYEVPWRTYNQRIKGFEMVGNITSIMNFAFFGCDCFVSIEIPEGIELVGKNSFRHCINLKVLKIPNSVRSWDPMVTEECDNLEEITVSNDHPTFKSVGGVLFNKEQTKIVAHPCRKGTTNYTVPDNVTEIGFSAFCKCKELESIIFSDGVTAIGSDAFSDCTSLASVVLPQTVIEIGNGAFSGCSLLKSIKIPDNVSAICDKVFNDCSSLSSIILPNTITKIGDSAFSGCSGLKSINVPDNVTVIGSYAFSGCSSLTSLNLPQTITEIGNSAFSGCTGLKSINISGNINKVSSNLFSGCTSLTSIVLPQSVKEIEIAAFFNCNELKSINIPASVTKIGIWPFYACSSLTSLVLPQSTNEIGVGAFSNCSQLKSINIPGTVKKIESHVFYGCTSLTSIVLPPSITEIGDSAFHECSGLKSINIPYNVTRINSTAFAGCSSLTSIIIPKSVKIVTNDAFVNCTNLKYVRYDGSEDPNTSGSVFGNCPLTYACVPLKYINSSFCGIDVVKSSSCGMLINECYISEYNGSEWNTEKKDENETAEWENRTNECATFYCDNETGYQTRSKCGDEGICVEDKCEDEEEKTGICVVMDIEENSDVTISNFVPDELKNKIYILTNSTSGNMRIGFKLGEGGKIKSIIIYVDNKNVADKIVSYVKDLQTSGVCSDEYHVLCRTTNVHIKSKENFISAGTVVAISYVLMSAFISFVVI